MEAIRQRDPLVRLGNQLPDDERAGSRAATTNTSGDPGTGQAFARSSFHPSAPQPFRFLALRLAGHPDRTTTAEDPARAVRCGVAERRAALTAERGLTDPLGKIFRSYGAPSK